MDTNPKRQQGGHPRGPFTGCSAAPFPEGTTMGENLKPAASSSQVELEQDLCIHIFSVSAAMVGVCLTVIGILRIVITLQQVNNLADDALAFDALLFLITCLLSYWSLRTRNRRRMHRVEKAADILFLLALALMVVVCGIITYAIL
jgi:hypothetical protein